MDSKRIRKIINFLDLTIGCGLMSFFHFYGLVAFVIINVILALIYEFSERRYRNRN